MKVENRCRILFVFFFSFFFVRNLESSTSTPCVRIFGHFGKMLFEIIVLLGFKGYEKLKNNMMELTVYSAVLAFFVGASFESSSSDFAISSCVLFLPFTAGFTTSTISNSSSESSQMIKSSSESCSSC